MIRINKHLAYFSLLFLTLGFFLLLITKKFFPFLDHVTYYCTSLINSQIMPVPYYLVLIPFALLFLILAIASIKFIALYAKVYFLRKQLHSAKTVNSSLSKLIEQVGLADKTIVISSNKHYAFCLGINHPKIYISTGLVSQLTNQELKAVLSHEEYHLKNHDTFTMLLASVTYSLFPFFPLIGDLINKYRIEREIQADAYAINRTGDSSALISALKKLLSFPTSPTLAHTAIADHDTLEPRIYSLLHKPYNRRQFRIKHAVITVISAFTLGAIVVGPVYAQEIHHEEHDVVMVCTNGACLNTCTSDNNLNMLYELPSSGKVNQSSFSQASSSIQH